MDITTDATLNDVLRAAAYPLDELVPDYDQPFRVIGDARFILLGEASHGYFHARIADQFDAVLHFDETRAVEPLERCAEWEAGEVPETFPFAV